VNFGYKGEVLLPIPVQPPATLRPGDVFRVEAEATWLVCEQVCIPEEGRFTLTLPVAPASTPSAFMSPLFEAAEARMPRPLPWSARAGAGPGRASLTLAGPGISPATVREAFFFPAEPGPVPAAGAQALRVADGSLTLGLPLADGVLPTALDGVVVLRDGGGQPAAFTVSAAVAGPPAGAGTLPGVWRAAGLAFLGGLLLNLMPCVFPVLAMKAMGLARLSGEARRTVRIHAGAMTAGVVVSFLVLGAGLVALRAGGAVVGWGFQFTQPAFVAAMAWLMLAVGLNLSGVYAMGRPVGLGQGAAARGGPGGAFATGVLAVLVATPCTAPFMAAALGAALAMPLPSTLVIFGALGLGMAAPYAVLGLAPGLARRLPRPGPWMERLRQGLAFPMYGAAAWLVWVLAQQAGPDGVFFALAGGVLVAAGLWVLGLAQGGTGRLAGRAAATLALGAALALLPRLSSTPAQAAADPGAEAWSEARVAALRAEGRPVFVNATAAWCITCQVNERVALRAEAVRLAFDSRRVAYLKADWTRGDAAIGALLRAHGRGGRAALPLLGARRGRTGDPAADPD
jgi:thiol:disulfide interchange protein DsbD